VGLGGPRCEPIASAQPSAGEVEKGLLGDLGLALTDLGQLKSRTAMVTLAQAAEELGFALVWTPRQPEHTQLRRRCD
jgi:hypothetical protein